MAATAWQLTLNSAVYDSMAPPAAADGTTVTMILSDVNVVVYVFRCEAQSRERYATVPGVDWFDRAA